MWLDGMAARGLVSGGTAAVRHGGGIASQRLPGPPHPPGPRRSPETVAGSERCAGVLAGFWLTPGVAGGAKVRRPATLDAVSGRFPSQVCFANDRPATLYAAGCRNPSQVCALLHHLQRFRDGTGAGVCGIRRLRVARLPGQNGKAQSARARCLLLADARLCMAKKKLETSCAWGWWRRKEKSSEGIFLPEETFSFFAKAGISAMAWWHYLWSVWHFASWLNTAACNKKGGRRKRSPSLYVSEVITARSFRARTLPCFRPPDPGSPSYRYRQG